MSRRANAHADLFRFRAKAVRWVKFSPPLKKLEVRRKQDCFGDCRAVARAREASLSEQGLFVEWFGEAFGLGVVRMDRVHSAGLGWDISLGVCPQCQTVHWSEVYGKKPLL